MFFNYKHKHFCALAKNKLFGIIIIILYAFGAFLPWNDWKMNNIINILL